MMIATVSFAQIGYQVSLLDNATGEPRANETVSCEVTLTNSEGGSIYSGTQTVTSNEFGVLSLTVGNNSMFDNMDWTKLPLYVSVTVDGKLIGKSQVLNVPVAEYAKKTGVLTYENIGQKRIVSFSEQESYEFSGHSVSYINMEADYKSGGWKYVTRTGTAYICGNMVICYTEGRLFWGIYSEDNDAILIYNK